MVEVVWNEDGTFDIKGLDRVELVYTETGMADYWMKIHRETPDSKYEKMMENIVMPIREALYESDGDVTEFGEKIVKRMAHLLEEREDGDVTSLELAEDIGVSQNEVVGGLVRLIDGGYVSSDDGRPKMFYLTKKGWKFVGHFDN